MPIKLASLQVGRLRCESLHSNNMVPYHDQ
jgi:hypothetical protein